MLSTKKRTAFISGSAYEYGNFGDAGKNFIRNLSKALLHNDLKIISGFGLGVGSHVVDAVVEEIYLEKNKNIVDHLQVFPFPSPGQAQEARIHFRDDLIAQADIAIFVFGNKLEEIAVKEADGMIQEFGIARAHNAILIPVGASGYASERLWQQMMDDYDAYFTTREKFDLYRKLGDRSLPWSILIDTILEIAG